MEYRVQHITNNKKIIRDMDPEHITIHSTGNLNSTAQNERDNLNRPNNTTTTGFHIVVDDTQAIECIPLNEVAYHAGDGANGPGNNKSIGIEMCESGDRAKTIQNTVELVAKMLHERRWGVDRLKRHFDWSGKNCPRILSQNNWEGWRAFKIQVERELISLENGEKSKIDNEPSSWAKESIKWAVENNLTDGSNVKENISLERFITILHRYHLNIK